MAYEHILVETEDGVGIVTLNRPESLNAMNRKLSQRAARRGQDVRGRRCDRLHRHHRLRRTRVLRRRRHPRAARGRSRATARQELEAMRKPRSSYEISACAKPTIGMMNGLAYGGAAVLASSLDMRIGCEATRFRFLAAAYGRINSTWTLPNQVGWPMAKELLFTRARRRSRGGVSHRPAEPSGAARATAGEDDGTGADDRRQSSRRGDGGKGAAAAAEGREPGGAMGGGAAITRRM